MNTGLTTIVYGDKELSLALPVETEDTVTVYDKRYDMTVIWYKGINN
jgi:hypothetical protein